LRIRCASGESARSEARHYTEWEFDANSNRTKVMRKDDLDVEIQRETYYFDERNRHWKTSALFKEGTTTHADSVTTWERLKTGQVATMTDPLAKATSYTYDAALRLTKVTDAMGNEWSSAATVSVSETCFPPPGAAVSW
jgi:YD repeat-containing protein